jgi:ATP-binding cassette subfamily B protein
MIWMLLYALLAIASTVFMVIGPKLLGRATTRLFEGIVAKAMRVPGAAIDFSYIGHIALLLVGLRLLLQWLGIL